MSTRVLYFDMMRGFIFLILLLFLLLSKKIDAARRNPLTTITNIGRQVPSTIRSGGGSSLSDSSNKTILYRADYDKFIESNVRSDWPLHLYQDPRSYALNQKTAAHSYPTDDKESVTSLNTDPTTRGCFQEPKKATQTASMPPIANTTDFSKDDEVVVTRDGTSEYSRTEITVSEPKILPFMPDETFTKTEIEEESIDPDPKSMDVTGFTAGLREESIKSKSQEDAELNLTSNGDNNSSLPMMEIESTNPDTAILNIMSPENDNQTSSNTQRYHFEWDGSTEDIYGSFFRHQQRQYKILPLPFDFKDIDWQSLVHNSGTVPENVSNCDMPIEKGEITTSLPNSANEFEVFAFEKETRNNVNYVARTTPGIYIHSNIMTEMACSTIEFNLTEIDLSSTAANRELIKSKAHLNKVANYPVFPAEEEKKLLKPKRNSDIRAEIAALEQLKAQEDFNRKVVFDQFDGSPSGYDADINSPASRDSKSAIQETTKTQTHRKPKKVSRKNPKLIAPLSEPIVPIVEPIVNNGITTGPSNYNVSSDDKVITGIGNTSTSIDKDNVSHAIIDTIEKDNVAEIGGTSIETDNADCVEKPASESETIDAIVEQKDTKNSSSNANAMITPSLADTCPEEVEFDYIEAEKAHLENLQDLFRSLRNALIDLAVIVAVAIVGYGAYYISVLQNIYSRKTTYLRRRRRMSLS